MGYLDPALLSSSIDSAKCRVPSYAMAYINAMENGVDCDGPYNKLRSMIYMIKILECVQPETPGEGPVVPGPEPCPPCPPCPDCEIVEVSVRVTDFDNPFLIPFNWVEENHFILVWDSNGINTNMYAGSGDFNNPIFLNGFKQTIIDAIQNAYGITVGGTASYSPASGLSLDLSGTGVVPQPMNGLSISLLSAIPPQVISIPVTFSTT